MRAAPGPRWLTPPKGWRLREPVQVHYAVNQHAGWVASINITGPGGCSFSMGTGATQEAAHACLVEVVTKSPTVRELLFGRIGERTS